MNLTILDWTIIGPAFLAGILVISTHVPLGQEVLKRGIIFIDLAIAQVAGLGVIAADTIIGETEGFMVQMAAVTAALLAAALLNWTEKHWLKHQEAIIGTLFILAATASILLLAGNPHGGEYLKDLLVGQILWSTWESLLPTAILYGVLLGIWFTTRDKTGRIVFYVTFSFAVTASVQLVGIYLVFASLIIPALSTIRLQDHKRLWVGYALGVASYLTGILLSALLDQPTGAIIVWSMAMLGILTGHLIKLITNQGPTSAHT
jgi:zinc/manganese transport system permease protein